MICEEDVCVPSIECPVGAECGSIPDDGCEKPVDCGTCDDGYTCNEGDMICELELGEEGCTPGFWKNNAGINYNYKNGKNAKLQDNCWCGSYSATTTLGSAFGDIPEEFATDTMIDGINYGGKGGPAYNMLRHAVAALLNACSSDVESLLTEQYIKDTVVAALKPGGDIAKAHQEFADANESKTAGVCNDGTCETGETCSDVDPCDAYHNCPINSHCELKSAPSEEDMDSYLKMLSSEYGVDCGTN
jgi:hypothetical protein